MSGRGPVFVTGATGTQGGAVARALLVAGHPVRILVRDPDAAEARVLAGLGAEIIIGDLDDENALRRGSEGASGVFSVPVVGMDDDPDLELRGGRKLISAALNAAVPMFVHSSVARAGDHEAFVDWDTGKWWPRYWRDKATYNQMVKSAGFPHHVILKPAYMMENFIPPKALYMVPHLAGGQLLTAFEPDTKLDVIAADDIARFVVAAMEDFGRFDGEVIDLAATRVTMGELAAVIAKATGKPIEVVHLSAAEALARGAVPMVVDNHQWNNVEGYKVDIARSPTWGVPLTPLEEWADSKRSEFRVG